MPAEFSDCVMSVQKGTVSLEVLLGQWGAIENKGRAQDGETLTITFTPDGKLISVIHDGEAAHVFNHEYEVIGDELILKGPEEYANPCEARLRYWIDEAGNLVWEEGRNGASRFKRLS